MFDVVTPLDHQEIWPESLEVVERAGCVLIVKGSYDSARRQASLCHTWFVQADSEPKLWRRFDDVLQQVSFSEETIRQWLSEAGFSDVVFYDGDTCEASSPTTTRWFVRSVRL